MKLFKNKFQPGDRVIGKCKGEKYHGIAGTILKQSELSHNVYLVDFDECVDGVSFGGECYTGHGRSVLAKELRPLRRDPQKVSEKELMKIISKL